MTTSNDNKGDLPYDYEDFGMDEQELKQKYAETGVHPEHSLEAYRKAGQDAEAAHNGYWDWVVTQIAKDDHAY